MVSPNLGVGPFAACGRRRGRHFAKLLLALDRPAVSVARLVVDQSLDLRRQLRRHLHLVIVLRVRPHLLEDLLVRVATRHEVASASDVPAVEVLHLDPPSRVCAAARIPPAPSARKRRASALADGYTGAPAEASCGSASTSTTWRRCDRRGAAGTRTRAPPRPSRSWAARIRSRCTCAKTAGT